MEHLKELFVEQEEFFKKIGWENRFSQREGTDNVLLTQENLIIDDILFQRYCKFEHFIWAAIWCKTDTVFPMRLPIEFPVGLYDKEKLTVQGDFIRKELKEAIKIKEDKKYKNVEYPFVLLKSILPTILKIFRLCLIEKAIIFNKGKTNFFEGFERGNEIGHLISLCIYNAIVSLPLNYIAKLCVLMHSKLLTNEDMEDERWGNMYGIEIKAIEETYKKMYNSDLLIDGRKEWEYLTN